VPIILGTLLGSTMENNLRRAVTISNGDYLTLVGSPLAIGLWVVAIVGFVLPVFVGRLVRSRMRGARDQDAGITD